MHSLPCSPDSEGEKLQGIGQSGVQNRRRLKPPGGLQPRGYPFGVHPQACWAQEAGHRNNCQEIGGGGGVCGVRALYTTRDTTRGTTRCKNCTTHTTRARSSLFKKPLLNGCMGCTVFTTGCTTGCITGCIQSPYPCRAWWLNMFSCGCGSCNMNINTRT